MVQGITRIVVAFFLLRHLFGSNSNNGPSPGQSNIGQMEDTSVQVPTCGLLVSAISGQGPRLDFNNGPGDNSNSGRIFAHRRSFESNSKAPLQVIPILGQMEDTLFRSPTYGLLVSAMSGQLPRLHFNNGPGDNSNSGRILAPSVYPSPIRIMATPPGHSNLGTLKITTA